MNIEQIKYILEVTKARSITKAAANLHLSPSAVSQSISQLEKELGITIFNRSRQGTVPTLDGKKIIRIGNEILTKIDELYNEFSTEKKERLLRVGCAPSLTYIVYDAFLLFNKEYPYVHIEIKEMNIDEMLNAMKDETIDIAFSPFSLEDPATSNVHNFIRFRSLYTGYICVCVSSRSHLYYKNFITLKDLENEKMVMYSSNRSITFNTELFTKVPILFTSNNIEVLRAAIIDGHASCLIYNFTFKNNQDVKNGNLAVIPLKNPEIINHQFWTLIPKSKGISAEAEEFQKKVMFILNES
ncbi:LysR family transcriptional regulator [Rossellomorea aquimaris]|uniref:LysR family transcriptional regulator n=1 Tax=Rossellomorea aquimaris TaxID=189382 RepID=UPI003CF57F64